jgi:hypothetical protein
VRLLGGHMSQPHLGSPHVEFKVLRLGNGTCGTELVTTWLA